MNQHKPRLKRDWEGLQVRTLREMRNGWCVIAAGTICTVQKNYGGITMQSDPCPHCGVRVSISHVSEKSVEILFAEAGPPGEET